MNLQQKRWQQKQQFNMHLKPKYINTILNILLGAAWASVLFAFLWGFGSVNSNFLFKLITGLAYSVFSLISVLFIEALYRFFLNHELLKEQVKLLKELNKKSD